MATETNPDPTGAQAQGAAQAASAAGQGSGSTAGYATQGFEGSLKQATDINTEEALAVLQSIVAANAKRTYDEAQTFDLATKYNDVSHRQRVNTIAEQVLQNAVETANMLGKQAVRHGDIAIDRQWNVDEQGYQVADILRDQTFKDAIAAAVAAAVNKNV